MGLLKDKIYSSCLERKQHEPERLYIGFSIIGHICNRYLWLQYHHSETAKPMTEKQAIIFENGHHIESKLIHQLRQAGLEITDQQVEMSLLGGNFKGHIDGIINHPEYGKVVLEIKGIKKSNWNKYVKKGIKETSPTYYAQAIMYSGYLKLPGTLFLIENKEDCDIYEEFIPSDFTTYSILCQKAHEIIHGKIPRGISERIDWFMCINCKFNNDDACRKKWNESPF